MAVLAPGEPRGRVARCVGAARLHLIVRRVFGALAVVQRPHHDGPVDIAVQEFHQHLLPHSGHEMAAPVAAGHRLRHSDPGAQLVLGGRVFVT
ncbi:hypothetical protein D3C71_1663960 [compost metagenome]